MADDTELVEYDLILGEDEEEVLFLVNGKEVAVPREDLVQYDEEGRLWLTAEAASRLGLA